VRKEEPGEKWRGVSAREAILRRLATTSIETPLPAVYAANRVGAAETTTRFVERATDVGAEVRLIAAANLSDAVVDAVIAGPRGTVATDGVIDVVIWKDSLLDAAAEALRRAGVRVLNGDGATSDAAATAAFGLTTVDHAIAETGTLVLAGGPGRSRSASLLPAHHVAVLPEDRIYADLFALMEAIRRPLPSALTFITGPSRSADIGLTPVRPAHGPTSVTILVISATRAETAARAP
jgi:L-lactate utilization protein LutC